MVDCTCDIGEIILFSWFVYLGKKLWSRRKDILLCPKISKINIVNTWFITSEYPLQKCQSKGNFLQIWKKNLGRYIPSI